jgi:hypothetical protein
MTPIRLWWHCLLGMFRGCQMCWTASAGTRFRFCSCGYMHPEATAGRSGRSGVTTAASFGAMRHDPQPLLLHHLRHRHSVRRLCLGEACGEGAWV